MTKDAKARIFEALDTLEGDLGPSDTQMRLLVFILRMMNGPCAMGFHNNQIFIGANCPDMAVCEDCGETKEC